MKFICLRPYFVINRTSILRAERAVKRVYYCVCVYAACVWGHRSRIRSTAKDFNENLPAQINCSLVTLSVINSRLCLS